MTEDKQASNHREILEPYFAEEVKQHWPEIVESLFQGDLVSTSEDRERFMQRGYEQLQSHAR